MANILRHFKWFDTEGQPWHRMFCDEPLPNLIADLLIGLYGYPYHVNLGKLLRFHYTAKVTPMYTDVFILDQARYLYDFQSSMSLFKLNSSLANQLIIRICIDAIGRHGYCGYPDLFRGSALASINEAGFTIYDWPERKSIQS